MALLRERWAQVKDGLRAGGAAQRGSGDRQIASGTSAEEHVAAEPQAWLTPCQCSPYYQNTTLYPMIDLLERVALRFERKSPRSRSSANSRVLGAVWPALAELSPSLPPSSPCRWAPTMPL